jgi:hypothetical protein
MKREPKSPSHHIPFTGHGGPSTFMSIDRALTVSATFLALALALQQVHWRQPRVGYTRLYAHTARGFLFGHDGCVLASCGGEYSRTKRERKAAGPWNPTSTSLVVPSLRLGAHPG